MSDQNHPKHLHVAHRFWEFSAQMSWLSRRNEPWSGNNVNIYQMSNESDLNQLCNCQKIMIWTWFNLNHKNWHFHLHSTFVEMLCVNFDCVTVVKIGSLSLYSCYCKIAMKKINLGFLQWLEWEITLSDILRHMFVLWWFGWSHNMSLLLLSSGHYNLKGICPNSCTLDFGLAASLFFTWTLLETIINIGHFLPSVYMQGHRMRWMRWQAGWMAPLSNAGWGP